MMCGYPPVLRAAMILPVTGASVDGFAEFRIVGVERIPGCAAIPIRSFRAGVGGVGVDVAVELLAPATYVRLTYI